MRVDYVSDATLRTDVLNGEFNSQQHLSALAAAQLRGITLA